VPGNIKNCIKFIFNFWRKKMSNGIKHVDVEGAINEIANNIDHMYEFYTYKVPGGWIIYRDSVVMTRYDDFKQFTSTAIFVSDPDHTWQVDYSDI
jgi:hypothetical protein